MNTGEHLDYESPHQAESRSTLDRLYTWCMRTVLLIVPICAIAVLTHSETTVKFCGGLVDSIIMFNGAVAVGFVLFPRRHVHNWGRFTMLLGVTLVELLMYWVAGGLRLSQTTSSNNWF